MKKLVTLVLAALVSGAALAQSMWLVGPTQVAALNGKLDGDPSLLGYAEGEMATLYNFDDSGDAFFGVDATFGSTMVRARSFVIVLNAVTKTDASAFDHFEAFDFTIKSWIEIGATTQPGGRPSLTGNPTLVSASLGTARFAHPLTGEVWARAMWNSAIWNSKGEKVVYLDQLALMYCR